MTAELCIVNPLRPNINIHILLTILLIYLMLLVRRIRLKIQDVLSLVIINFFFILMIIMYICSSSNSVRRN